MTSEELKTLKEEIAAFERGELEELQRGRWVKAEEFNKAGTYRIKPKPLKIWVEMRDGMITRVVDAEFNGAIILEESAPLREKLRVKDEALHKVLCWLYGRCGEPPTKQIEEALKV